MSLTTTSKDTNDKLLTNAYFASNRSNDDNVYNKSYMDVEFANRVDG